MNEVLRFGAIVTDLGNIAMANAYLTNQLVPPAYFAVGDGGGAAYTPSSNQTALRGEVWRGRISYVEQDTEQPNKLRFYSAIPAVAGPFIIREMAIYNENGLMIAVCNTPTLEKPVIDSGAVLDMSVGMTIVVDHPETLTKLEVDPKVILLSRTDLNRHDGALDAHETRFGRLEAVHELVKINHELGLYPLIMAGWARYALGVGGLGDGPAGGGETTQCPVQACYLDAKSLTVLVTRQVIGLGMGPELHRINAREYTVTWPDNHTDSLYIRLI